MRRIFLVLGALLGILATAGLLYINQARQPRYAEILVAVDDLPAGTSLRAAQFRVARWANVDAPSLAQFVTVEGFKAAEGHKLTSDAHAGLPLAKIQIDSDLPKDAESRLSAVITGTNSYYAVLPVSPDDIGNWVQPNDRIDLLISLGQLDARQLTLPQPLETAAARAAQVDGGSQPSVTLMMPVTKLVLQNLRVIRVDREASRVTSASTNRAKPAGLGGQFAAAGDAPSDEGMRDIKRIYVEVTRDQLEALTFLKRNGQHDFAVRAGANNSGAIVPTEGIAFEDYTRWFFAQRNNQGADGAAPFESAGPYAPAPR